VKEQNGAREVIVQRMIEVNPKLQAASHEEVLTEFARMNQEKSVKGTWIQLTDGQWIKKATDPAS
jgi:uncharacterized protein YdbL (DUF1318 family)